MTTGIWRHGTLFDDDATVARARAAGWTLGEGDTPLEDRPDLAAAVGCRRLLLKREDLNPGGSHKDRGLLFQVARLGAPAYVVSSSGNAAISAAAACRATGARLFAFVAADTHPGKMAAIADQGGVLVVAAKPKNFARYAARVFGLPNLRATLDPQASVGYRSLGVELHEAAPDLDAVATFSTSGASLAGLGDGLLRCDHPVALWAVQSGTCLGLVRVRQPDTPDDLDSPAGRLGTRTPPDADSLVARLEASGGGAIAVGAEEIEAMRPQLALPDVAAEGPAVLAAVARLGGSLAGQTVAAVITGRERPDGAAPPAEHVGSYLDVRGLLQAHGLEPAS